MLDRFFRTTALLLASILAGCQSAKQTSTPPAQGPALPAAPAASQDGLVEYPRARWRLVSGVELGRVLVWASHLLIRHAESDRQATAALLNWYLDEPPTRSRAEALALAQQLAEKLRLQPERFPELARAHSEDPSSAAFGGSLGGVRASDLMDGPALLDALAALKVGEVSRVVETSHGFHIVQRHPPPPETRVSALHLVIGHRNAPTLVTLGGGGATRSRAEALALANELHRSAALDPAAFPALIQQRSEHPDRVNGGDLGSWSSREPTQQALAVQALQRLPVGGLTQPIETPYGIEIFQRTAERPRSEYAVEALYVDFSPGQSDAKQAALQQASELAALLRADPTRFEELTRTHCCKGHSRWHEGREELGITAAVRPLAFQQFAPQPVEQYLSFAVVRRVDPQALPPEPVVSLELPAPERLDLEDMLQGMVSLDSIARHVLELAREHPPGIDPQHEPLLAEVEAMLAIEEAGEEARSRMTLAVRTLVEANAATGFRLRLERRVTEQVFGFPAPAGDRSL